MRLRKYGVQATIDFEVYGITGVDLKADWVPAQVDVEIMKDGGASTLCDNTATDEGVTFSIVLTATEMEFARGVLKIQDAATKVILDTIVHIETYGNASAQHAFDLDTASTPQTADHTAGIADIPTVAEFEARTIVSANYVVVGDTIAGVTLVTTCTTNTDMVGTNSAALASVLGAAVGASISADIADLPTVAEFEARTIVSADYVVVGDTIARVTLTDTVTTYTGNTKQTGNNFTRLGAPAGASVSADILAVKTETASIQTETTALDTLTKAAGDGDLAAIKVILDALTAAGATKLALGATTMITGIVSWDNTNATTTVIYSSDIIEATADHFNGRLFVPTSGALLGQYTDITDYALDAGEGKFTVTAMTEPPADNTTFVIL